LLSFFLLLFQTPLLLFLQSQLILNPLSINSLFFFFLKFLTKNRKIFFFWHCIKFSCYVSLFLLFFFFFFLNSFPLFLLLLLSLHFFLKLFLLLLNLRSLLTFPHICIRLRIIDTSFHPWRNCRAIIVTLFIFQPSRWIGVLGTILIILHPSRLVVRCIRLDLYIFGPSRCVCRVIFRPNRLIISLYSVLIIFYPWWLITHLYRFCLNSTFIRPRLLLRRIIIIFNPTGWVSFLH